jgi:hypothetical protein
MPEYLAGAAKRLSELIRSTPTPRTRRTELAPNSGA